MSMPNFNHEKVLWRKGLNFVAGCDEVGRGCFAGPVIASVVCFPAYFKGLPLQGSRTIKIDDSKKLTQKQRSEADIWIRQNTLAFGIGEASVGQINRLGIVKATQIAMRLAIKNSKVAIDHLLIDAFYIPYAKGIKAKQQTPIIKGDSLSFSIAAASIIAKVYRDKLMRNLGEKYKVYGWNANKGYGTYKHREAILKYGLTKHHRSQFVNTFLSKSHIQHLTT